MEKYCVYEVDGQYVVRVTVGIEMGPDCLGCLPPDTPRQDFDFVVIKDGVPVICEKKKSAWMKEQIKNAISE